MVSRENPVRVIQLNQCSVRGASLQAMVKLYDFEQLLLLTTKRPERRRVQTGRRSVGIVDNRHTRQ
jgi:hypothetical protein